MMPVHYFIIPPVVIDLLWSSGWSIVVYAVSRDKWSAFLAFGVMIIIGIPIGIWGTGEIFRLGDPKIMQMEYELRMGNFVEQKPVTMLINTGEETHRIGDISADEWRDMARKVVNGNYEFKVGTVGRQTYDKFRPLLIRDEHFATAKPNGVVELTTRGKKLINHLSPTEYESGAFQRL